MRHSLSSADPCSGVAVLLVATACAAGAPSPGQAASDPIVHGVLDSGHPSVVAVEAPGWLCSGTLVAARVVVTAAHCLPPDPTDLRVFFGSDVSEAGDRLAVVGGTVHPEYDAATPRNDLAVLRLAEEGPATPSPMRRAPLDEAFVGAEVTLVGFGVVGADGDGAGRKRRAVSKVTSLSPREFWYGETPGQTCHGDSGGPAFFLDGGKEVLVGVTSRGDATCSRVGIDTRVDPYVAGFIQPCIDAAPETPGGTPDAAPAAGGGCGEVTEVGACRDNVLVYCDAGALVSVDCDPDFCAWDPIWGWYDCLGD